MFEQEFHRIDAIVAGPMVRWTPEGWAESALKQILAACATPANLDADTVVVRRRKSSKA